MMSRFFLKLILLCWLAVHIVAQSSPQDQLKAFSNLVNAPVAYRVPGMDEVHVKTNIVYKKDPNADFLQMDLYTPPAKTKELFPVVIFIHGGVPANVPLKPKDWGIYKSWGRLIAASGMAAVTFNHRVSFPDPNLEQGPAT